MNTYLLRFAFVILAVLRFMDWHHGSVKFIRNPATQAQTIAPMRSR